MISKYKDQFKIKQILKNKIENNSIESLHWRLKFSKKKEKEKKAGLTCLWKQNDINYSLNIKIYYTNSN